MNVVNALTRVRSGVHDDSEAALGHAVLGRQPPGHRHRVADGRPVLFLQIRYAADVFPGNDQEMHRRVGVDVPEGQHGFVTVDDIPGYLPGGDTAEQTVGHYSSAFRLLPSGQNARTVPSSISSGTGCSQAPAQGPQTHSPVVGS